MREKVQNKCRECGKVFEDYKPRVFCSLDCRKAYTLKHPRKATEEIRKHFMLQNVERRPLKKSEVLAMETKKKDKGYAERKEYLVEHSIMETMIKNY